jgi:ABC-2 type transport system ATP-binding protein
MNNSVVQASQLNKRYKQLKALNDVSFDIKRGQILGLLGPNGAGKTTLLKAILGLTTYDGQLSVLGLNPSKDRTKLMESMCFIADVAVLPKWLEVSKSIDFVEGVHPKFNRKKALDFLKETEIQMNSKIGTLSKGMIVQLHLALVMAIDVEILVLDEPTLGLDIIYRKHFYRSLLNDYYDENRTIIITTHQIEEVEGLLTDLMMINHGKVVLHESMEALAEEYLLVNAKPSEAEALRALKPVDESKKLNEIQFLFQGVDKATLTSLGSVSAPSVSDIFVSIVKGEQK